MLFYRTNTDRREIDCTQALRDSHGGTNRTSCIIIGGGPSLRSLEPSVAQAIQDAPIAKLAVNNGGRDEDGKGWIIKPNLWTSFDAIHKFSSVLLQDPTITKFIRPGNAKKQFHFAHGTNVQVCDCPNTYIINHAHCRYEDFFNPHGDAVTDQCDSLIQAIDIAIKLGYRDIYTLGTELIVRPSPGMFDKARECGVSIEDSNVYYEAVPPKRKKDQGFWSDRLEHFVVMVGCRVADIEPQKIVRSEGEAIVKRDLYSHVRKAGIAALADCSPITPYCFTQTKELEDLIRMDEHYYVTVQRLRQARRALSKWGVQLFDASNGRLSAWFRAIPPTQIASCGSAGAGRYELERLDGRYNKLQPMSDLPEHQDIPAIRAGLKGRMEEQKGKREAERRVPVEFPDKTSPVTPSPNNERIRNLQELREASVQIKETA